MRFGSLFSGIGGLDLGLERAGMQCAWQVEIDPYARRVLEKHWPDVKRCSDVREVTGRVDGNWFNRNLVTNVDLICGGFPCQDISVAGKGKGLAGERSGLWREYARIVDEVRPAWVLIENVPALRSRGLRTVLGDLHACGYNAEWDGVSASALGAPHRRDRLFVVAHSSSESLRIQQRRGGWQNGTRALVFGRDGITRDVADAQRLSRDARRTGDTSEGARGRDADRGGERSSNVVCGGVGQWSVEPDVGRVAHGVPFELDLVGSGVIRDVKRNGTKANPAALELVWRLLRSVWELQSVATTSPDVYGRRLRDSLPELSHELAHGRWYLGQRLQKDEGLRSLWEVFYAKPLEEAQNLLQGLLERIGKIERSKTVGRVDRLRGLGNAVVPQVAEYVGRLIMAAATT